MSKLVLVVIFCYPFLSYGTPIEYCPEEPTSIETLTIDRRGYGGGIFDRSFYSEFWHKIMHGHGRIRKGYNVEYCEREEKNDNNHTAPVPEPCTLMLFGFGMVGFLFLRKKGK